MVFGIRSKYVGSSSLNQHVSRDEGLIDLDEDNNNGWEDSTETQVPLPTQPKDELKPLYDEVTIIGLANGKNPGGAKIWVCNHCHTQATSSYTRIHTHFFGPPVGKKADIKRCPNLVQNTPMYEALLKRVKEAEKAGVSKSLKNSVLSKKHNSLSSSSKTPLEKAFCTMERNEVDMKIMRALCANGIPFNVLRNPHFCEMVEAIRKAPVGYKPPSSEKARTTLLDECYRSIKKDLTPFEDTWFTQGLSIVSDGWTNVKHEPLINVVASNSRGSMFMYAENFTGVEKTGVAIGEFIMKAIEQVGKDNVLQVITDNAANCKAAGKEIEKVYNHIFWSPCTVHTLNLIFKDLATNFNWLSDTYKRGKVVVKFFVNHCHALAMFQENSKLTLLKVAKTRFASHYILLKRLVICREALATTVSLNSWRDWVRNCDENTRQIGLGIVETIRSDSFWESVESILAITKPIYLMIKFCDGEGSKMAEVYERMDNMLGEIQDAMVGNIYASHYPGIKNIVLKRWEKMSIPLHCLGFALNPRYYDKGYLEKVAPGGMERRAPNLDNEVVTGLIEAFERIAESKEEESLLREQYVTFHMKKGLYGLAATQLDAVTMGPIEWWSCYGSETPELAVVAKRVLSQPISSSSAERNWSTYSYVHNVKRNRLNDTRADKLVFVHSNIRLISRFSESYRSGPHKNWDVNHDSTNLVGANAINEGLQWDDLDEEGVENGRGKRQRME